MIELERKAGRFSIAGASTKKALLEHLRLFDLEERRVLWIGKVEDIPHWLAKNLVFAYNAGGFYKDHSINSDRECAYHINALDCIKSYMLQNHKRSKWCIIRGVKGKRYAKKKFMLMREVA